MKNHLRIKSWHFLLGIALISIPFSFIVNAFHVRQTIVREIYSAGGQVYYDYQWQKGRFVPSARSWVPNFILQSVGVDAFHHVVWVRFQKPLSNTSVLEKLHHLNKLEILKLDNTKLDDDKLRFLSSLTSLKSLSLSNLNVTSKGIEPIARLPHLKLLYLGNTMINNDSISIINRCVDLEYIDLSGTLVTTHGIRSLSSLRKLKTLILNDTKVDATVLRSFLSFKSISVVSLKKTLVTKQEVIDFSIKHNIKNLVFLL